MTPTTHVAESITNVTKRKDFAWEDRFDMAITNQFECLG